MRFLTFRVYKDIQESFFYLILLWIRQTIQTFSLHLFLRDLSWSFAFEKAFLFVSFLYCPLLYCMLLYVITLQRYEISLKSVETFLNFRKEISLTFMRYLCLFIE